MSDPARRSSHLGRGLSIQRGSGASNECRGKNYLNATQRRGEGRSRLSTLMDYHPKVQFVGCSGIGTWARLSRSTSRSEVEACGPARRDRDRPHAGTSLEIGLLHHLRPDQAGQHQMALPDLEADPRRTSGLRCAVATPATSPGGQAGRTAHADHPHQGYSVRARRPPHRETLPERNDKGISSEVIRKKLEKDPDLAS